MGAKKRKPGRQQQRPVTEQDLPIEVGVPYSHTEVLSATQTPSQSPAPYRYTRLDAQRVLLEDPGVCKICQGPIAGNQRRQGCTKPRCPAPFSVHVRCVEKQLKNTKAITVSCLGCRNISTYESTWHFKNVNWLWVLIGFGAFLFLIFGIYYVLEYFATGFYFPGGGRSLGNQTAMGIVLWCMLGVMMWIAYSCCGCCCFPLKLICGLCRKSDRLNY